MGIKKYNKKNLDKLQISRASMSFSRVYSMLRRTTPEDLVFLPSGTTNVQKKLVEEVASLQLL